MVEDSAALNALLDQFVRITGYKILVHGGGNTATEVAAKLGIETQMVDGRRITSQSMLEVVTMVYGGLVNKKVVAQLQARGCNAIGLSGADLNLISAKKRPVNDVDYGFVGDVDDVNSRELRFLINENVVPVVAPLTHDGKGQLLNTNADTMAAELAGELANHYSVYLFFCFDKKGVLMNPEDEGSMLHELSAQEFIQYQNEKVISMGMIPKLENGFKAKRRGVKEVLITNTENIMTGRGTRLI